MAGAVKRALRRIALAHYLGDPTISDHDMPLAAG